MLTIVATALLFLTIWIVIPAPNVWLLPLSVGAPEVSPILFAASVLTLVLSLRKASARKIAVLFSLAAAGLSVIPYSQMSRVQREFDRELARVYPAFAQGKAPAGLRPAPFAVKELLTGIETGDNLRIVRAIKFGAPEGMPLVLDIYRPSSDGPHPMLVQIYGGAWQGGNRTDNETSARYFASKGYVVFAIEYRHAPRWAWPTPLQDVREAIAWVRAQAGGFGGDPNRLAVIGRSAGAHLALLAAYSGDSRVDAVAAYYAPTDLTRGWQDEPKPDPLSVRSVLETFLGGTPETVAHRYREASPITYASAGAPPTLLIYGKRDHVVLPGFGRDLHAKLREMGARSMYLEIPWADHAFDSLPGGLSGQVSLYYTERFLAAAMPRRRGA